MSSVYRKGRDGYYYYQAYLHNPSSNKKDKRIFHSLKTKDKVEAKKKQKEFDLIYERGGFNNTSLRFFINKLKSSKKIRIIGSLISLILFFLLFQVEKNKNFNTAVKQKKIDNIEEKKIKSIISDVKVESNKLDRVENTLSEKSSDIQNNIIDEIISEYSIERFDKVYGSTKIGQLHVTIDPKFSRISQLSFCRNLAKNYSEFLNIVICLYSNNVSGKQLAIGNEGNISLKDKKTAWLSMYTFNEFEGEFFDDNPSNYLNSY
jgi:hypothetical protein